MNSFSAAHGWKNWVYYSNGNGALRHLEVPTVTVQMDIIADKQIPVGLTFAGRAYDDLSLLKWANAFKNRTRLKLSPPLTPPLQTDTIVKKKGGGSWGPAGHISITKCSVLPTDDGSILRVNIASVLCINGNNKQESLKTEQVIDITIDCQDVPAERVSIINEAHTTAGDFIVRSEAQSIAPRPLKQSKKEVTWASVACEQTMIVLIARSELGGYLAG